MRSVNWIILLCILTSLGTWYLNSTEYSFVVQYLVFSGENLLRGRVWTLVTALFVHADLLHLGSNMMFLYVFGNTLEDRLNENKPMTAFLVGGVISFLVGLAYYSPTTIMVGASAAIFTLTAIVILVNPLKFSFFFMMPLGLVSMLYFLYNAIAVYMGLQGNVAYIGHVTGFLLGIPLGIAWSENWKKNLLITIGLVLLYFAIQLILAQLLA